MIRRATSDDIPAMLDLGELFYPTTPPARVIPFNRVSTRFLFEAMLGESNCVVLVSEQDGRVVGGIGGTLAPATYNMDYLVVLENFWFFRPDQRQSREAMQLKTALEVWAKEQGAVMNIMGEFPGEYRPRLRRIYGRGGYQEGETLHYKEL